MNKFKKWSDSELDFLIKNYSNMTYKSIAKSLDRTPKGTSKKVRELKLKKINFLSCSIEKNNKYFKLTAKEFSRNQKKGKELRRYWIFKCECGKEKEISIKSVITGLTRSCGCLKKEVDRTLLKKEPGFASWTHVFKGSQMSAEDRKIPYFLTKFQYSLIASGPCHYCGVDPKPWIVYLKKDGTKRPFKYKLKKDTIDRAWIKVNGVDRKDNSLGYTVENCVPCCFNCNEMKMDRDVDFFISHVKRINNFWNNK